MTEREKLLEKLEKIKALADRGERGEKETAERLLARLMKQYGISVEELEDAKISTHWIRYKTEWESKLISQLAYMRLGHGHTFGCVGAYTERPRKKVGIDCTPAQYIEIEADFTFYSAALEEEMKLFYRAFLNKNNLFPPPELAGDPVNDEDVDQVEAMKVSAIMMGLDHHTRRKGLEAAANE